MSEVLSQSEIDALLSALTSGQLKAEEIREAAEEKSVRVYDFRRAMRFSKDQMRIIARIHEHFARLLTTQLAAQLRIIVQIQVESVDQVPYEEFIRSVPALTVMEVMEFTPLTGKVVVEMNPQVVFALLDRMLGGTPQGPYRERELTEIEQGLLERGLSGMGNFFAEAWRSVADLNPHLLTFESNPQFLQLATPNETVLVITLSARIGGVSGLWNICIPYVTVEPLVPKLTTQYLFDAAVAKQDGSSGHALAGHMQAVDVEVTAELGSADLTLEELLDINVDDMIPLNTGIHDPIRVFVDGVPMFTARLGRSRDKMAVQVLSLWKEVYDDDGPPEAVAGGD
ncbi:flagellar motor switch protein FliM [Alicyclobacillus shizuokensis]|uniref:flagellar motor switch protein FliM n=1 Tax=Alicyclobacillus shizuokensis TaxID=392014 RepID=UPI00082D4B64|nr:flagellar motor switch protein FliM [Alicyclobacillus shizuokensis]MCL6625937.1 flagellar motor switch protein FliM [Alicyclobacillus shizuokensis]